MVPEDYEKVARMGMTEMEKQQYDSSRGGIQLLAFDWTVNKQKVAEGKRMAEQAILTCNRPQHFTA